MLRAAPRLNAQFDFAACRQRMTEVSAKLYRPQPDENGIVPQFEGYFDLRHIDLGPVMTTSDAGVHTASMGGIWQCAVYGFGGLRVVGDELHVHPRLPEVWNALEFGVTWRGQKLRVTADKQRVAIANEGVEAVTVTLAGKATVIAAGQSVSAEIA